MIFDFKELNKNIDDTVLHKTYGTLKLVNGYKVVSIGPDVSKGDLCYLKNTNEEGIESNILCEVVGFNGEEKFLVPTEALYSVKASEKVYKYDSNLSVNISSDYLGCVLDGLGNITKDNGVKNKKGKKCFLYNKAPSPMERGSIKDTFNTGIRAIDGLLTIGLGQRIGIFAGSGVGKSTLLGNIIKDNNADINVVALIGERGREVLDSIEKYMSSSFGKTIVVAATSNDSALLRLKCAYTATAIAEHFRDEGKNVLLVMDSLTRFAMAQREIGFNTGEQQVTKYTSSVFSMLPELLERAGKNKNGSITAIYTVLVEGDDDNEIISDTVRGILDGHIVLSRDLALKNHYPAIDITKSISRVMNDLVSPEHKKAANHMRNILAYYLSKEDLFNLVYEKSKTGKNKNDRAIEYYEVIEKFLIQDENKTSFEDTKKFLIDNFLNVENF